MGKRLISGWAPIIWHLGSAHNTGNAALRYENAGVLKVGEAEIVGVRHVDRVTGLGFIHPEGLEPVETKAGRRIVMGIFLSQDFLANFVNKRDRCPYRHFGIVRLQHLGVAGEDTHTGTKSRLRHIDRPDAGLPDLLERVGHFALETSDELPTCCP